MCVGLIKKIINPSHYYNIFINKIDITMGKSWKDKNRRDKWDHYGKGGNKKPKKTGFDHNTGTKPNKWDKYEDYTESY